MEHISLINPEDSLEEQVAKQARIIEALLRRSNSLNSFGDSAYAAFQSAISLQSQIWAKTRDLERASTELESLRFDRERSKKNLADALSVMEGGFALFTDGRLEVFNDIFRTLLPDQSHRIHHGMALEDYLDIVRHSPGLRGIDDNARDALSRTGQMPSGQSRVSFVVGFEDDRWFQFSQQRTSSDNLIMLQTEITDVVRRNEVEKDMLKDRQSLYLQAAFENMSSGIATFSAEGELQMHNDGFRLLAGLPASLVQVGTKFSRILDFVRQNFGPVSEDGVGLENWRHLLRKEGQLRKRLLHPAGRVLDLKVHSLPDLGFLVDIADATLEAQTTRLLEERVQERTAELTEANRQLTEQAERQALVEEQLRLAKEQAEAAVSSKTRFLAAASHDLLQPMNAAKLLLSTLADATDGGDLSGIVDRLQGSFVSMEQLLQALLDISRLESTESEVSPTEVCLGPLMRSVIEDQLPLAAEKGVDLRVVPSSLWVRSDQRYLLRSIQNLVVNALQYTQSGRVLLGCRRLGDQVRLEVWDTGIGISDADQARIFEEFTRGQQAGPNGNGPGMGLGLSIVDRTCRHLGHQVSVRSEPGRGSVFAVTMAVAQGVAPVTVDVPAVAAAPDADLDLLVLAVENDPQLLFATVQVLEGWGASVFGTGSEAEALAVLEEIGIPPDVILADYHLDDGATGVAAIQAVRQALGRDIPAIMVTADRSAELLELGNELGFTVLTKPVDLPRLRRLIERVTLLEAGATPVIEAGTSPAVAMEEARG